MHLYHYSATAVLTLRKVAFFLAKVVSVHRKAVRTIKIEFHLEGEDHFLPYPPNSICVDQLFAFLHVRKNQSRTCEQFLEDKVTAIPEDLLQPAN